MFGVDYLFICITKIVRHFSTSFKRNDKLVLHFWMDVIEKSHALEMNVLVLCTCQYIGVGFWCIRACTYVTKNWTCTHTQTHTWKSLICVLGKNSINWNFCKRISNAKNLIILAFDVQKSQWMIQTQTQIWMLRYLFLPNFKMLFEIVEIDSNETEHLT